MVEVCTEHEIQKSLYEKRLSFALPVLITHPLMLMRGVSCIPLNSDEPISRRPETVTSQEEGQIARILDPTTLPKEILTALSEIICIIVLIP